MPIGMEMKLQVKLSQQLVMTPQLVQAIRLLQLSRLELVEEVRKELDGNPVLADDIVEPKETDKTERAAQNEPPPPAVDPDGAQPTKQDTDAQSRAENDANQEIDWASYLENQQLRQPLGSSRSGFEELPPIEQNLTKPSNLKDHLVWQLQMSDFVDTERHFALLVIGNLD
jgi:RNA polymerase sigma-54 factor